MSGTRVMLGLAAAALLERLLHRPAGGVVDMDDAAVAVAALAGQVPGVAVGGDVERHAQLGQPLDRRRRVFDDELDGGAVVEPGAGDHRVLDMALERVAGLEHRGDPALRPAGRARPPLASTATLKRWARFSAAVSPAAPEPMTRTSKALLSHPFPVAGSG